MIRRRTLRPIDGLVVQIGFRADAMSFASMWSTRILPNAGIACTFSEDRKASASFSDNPSLNSACAFSTASEKKGGALRSLSRSATGSRPAFASLRKSAAFSRASARVSKRRSRIGISSSASLDNRRSSFVVTSTDPKPISRRLPSTCTRRIHERPPVGATSKQSPSPSTCRPGFAVLTEASVNFTLSSPHYSPHNNGVSGDRQRTSAIRGGK